MSTDCAKKCLAFLASTVFLVVLGYLTIWTETKRDTVEKAAVVALAAATIAVGSVHENHLLSNPVMVWIGDISYVVYLVHWPVIQFRRYWSIEKTFTNKGTRLPTLHSH